MIPRSVVVPDSVWLPARKPSINLRKPYREYPTSGYELSKQFPCYQSNLAEAGLHEDAGDAAKALALYDRVLLPTVSTSFSTEAGTRREALLKKHPELAPVESEATVETVPEDAAP